MKFLIISAVLSCVVLSLANTEVNVTEPSLNRLEEVPQHVDNDVSIAEELPVVASPEVQRVLKQIPELVQAAADEQILENPTQNVENKTETIFVPTEKAPITNREAKQIIGFIPSYILRQAIHMAQEQQYNDHRSLSYGNEEQEDSSDEIEEERAVRRRKRFRKRNSKGHLKKSRRQNNVNRRKLNTRRKFDANRRTQNRRGNVNRRKNVRRPVTRNNKKKAYQRRNKGY